MSQEEALRSSARRSGRFRDLLVHLAMKGAWNRFHEAGRALPDGDAEGHLTYRLLGLTHAGEDAPWVMEHICGAQDSFFHYALTKFLLGRDDLKGALAVAKDLLGKDRYDTLPLNLVAKYAASRNSKAVALRLIENSIAINPDQRDMFLLREALAVGGDAGSVDPKSFRTYLEVAPKHVAVTFYVPAYNVEVYIRETVEALVAQSYPLAEIIIVDDGSRDGTLEIAREYPVRVASFEENKGLAAARNTGFREAATPFVGSVDADVCADPDYTVHIMMEFENASQDLAGVSGRLIEKHLDTPGDRWRARHLPQGWYPRRMYFDAPPPEGQEGPDSGLNRGFFLNGCNNVFRKDHVLEVGGYNEKYRTNSEDAMMCMALRYSGRHLAFTRSAVARHTRRDTLQSVIKTAWNYGFWGRQEGGLYRDAPTLLNNLHYVINHANAILAGDMNERFTDQIYADFLLLFHWALLDMTHAVKEGILTAEQAAYIQHAILAPTELLDRQFGGDLTTRVKQDSAHLLIAAQPRRESLPPELAALVDGFVTALSRDFETYPPRVYFTLTNP